MSAPQIVTLIFFFGLVLALAWGSIKLSDCQKQVKWLKKLKEIETKEDENV